MARYKRWTKEDEEGWQELIHAKCSLASVMVATGAIRFGGADLRWLLEDEEGWDELGHVLVFILNW